MASIIVPAVRPGGVDANARSVRQAKTAHANGDVLLVDRMERIGANSP